MTDEENQEKRTLFVPEGISWDAQWEHGVRLLEDGISVVIHDHAEGDQCRLDGAHCKCGILIDDDGLPTLELFKPRELASD
jgi:hypothetical protein